MAGLIEKTKGMFGDLSAWNDRREQVKSFDRAVNGGQDTIKDMINRPHFSDTWALHRAKFIVDASYDDAITADSIGKLANEIKDKTGSENGLRNKVDFLDAVVGKAVNLPLTVREARLGILNEVKVLTASSNFSTAAHVTYSALKPLSYNDQRGNNPDPIVNQSAVDLIEDLGFKIMNRGEHNKAGIIEQPFGEGSARYQFNIKTALSHRHEMIQTLLANSCDYPDVQKAILPYAQAIVGIARDQFGYDETAGRMESDIYVNLSDKLREGLKTETSAKVNTPQVV